MKPIALHSAAAAVFALASLALAPPAAAGECPREHVLTTPRQIDDAPDVGVEREILAMVHLKGWRGVGDLYLRTRRLTVAVGGIVPFHEHDDRPSIVYVVSGEIEEISRLCAVPILHRAGEWTPEFGPGHAHWWRNVGNVPVVLTSSDVVPPEMMEDPHM
jgi:quercetin dioxygenase-like cupin family protein